MKIGCTIYPPKKMFKSRKWWIFLCSIFTQSFFFFVFELRTNFFPTVIILHLFHFFFILTVYTLYYVRLYEGEIHLCWFCLQQCARPATRLYTTTTSTKKKKSSSSWLCFEMVLRKFFDFFLYNNFLPPPNYIYSFNFENNKKTVRLNVVTFRSNSI